MSAHYLLEYDRIFKRKSKGYYLFLHISYSEEYLYKDKVYKHWPIVKGQFVPFFAKTC